MSAARWTATLVMVGACVLARALPAAAHPGGHAVSPGTTLHVWADPESGRATPGSLLFVADGLARVEDPSGRIHTWRLTQLSAPDRAIADQFRARVEQINGVRHVAAPRAIEWRLWWLAVLGVGMAAGLLVLVRLARSWPAGLGAPGVAAVSALALACGGAGTSGSVTAPSTSAGTSSAASVSFPLSSYFSGFPGHVRTRQDSQYFYVESDGMADHTLMTGIRSWQQQVPLPQPYTGSNAYAIPLVARLAAQPVSAKTALFNGAIAVAVNGVPIFNALNNRGDDAYLFGELDDFGGHSGRADDYHYHAAPFQLSATVGETRPLAVALDGFPIYGTREPDGSAVRSLDDFNGHADGTTLYHYHGTRTYPYINGGMKGAVTVVSDHVDPQPTLKPVRPAGTPLSGATITAWSATGTNAWRLEYRLNNATYRVEYRVDGAVYTFVFTDPSGASRTETYTR